MRKLLRANISRLMKDKLFIILSFFMVAAGMITALLFNHNYVQDDMIWKMDCNLFTFVSLGPIAIALLVALFVGSDYSCGTLRNKIISGHKRNNIYLANLITCCFAGIVLSIAFVTVHGTLGLLIGGVIENTPTTLLLYGALSMGLMFAFTALFNLIAMLCQNKAYSVAACILLAIILICFGIKISADLAEPEYYSGYSYTADGTTVEEPEMKNPNYIDGTKREVYEFLQDFNPGGQMIQIHNLDTDTPGMLAIYDGIILLISTGIGLAVFRRKDLK